MSQSHKHILRFSATEPTINAVLDIIKSASFIHDLDQPTQLHEFYCNNRKK